ncbi:MAG: 3-hydroxyacyl-CoA dehydrogenase NAD-binding domain-containing protein [Rhizobiaceae bacterium]
MQASNPQSGTMAGKNATGRNNPIGKVAVIGAGTMGCGIAAAVASAGLEALLLDVAGGEGARNAPAERGMERIRQSNPPLLASADHIARISVGNVEDDLASLADCDWIVEAVVERLPVKHALYRAMQPHLKPTAIVSSNTSTIPLELLISEMPAEFASRFCITHFFNPVRYMRLLELVGGPRTDGDVIATMAWFCDEKLGKGIVHCADKPGFLGNRVGVFAMQAAIHEATSLGLDIEDADAVFGRPLGIPKTGAFALYDLIGLDLMADVVRSLRAILPQGDPFHEVGAENAVINGQIEKGFTGNKGKGGFFARIDGKAMALDLTSGNWRPRKKPSDAIVAVGEAVDPQALLALPGKAGTFARNVLSRVLAYSASLIGDVTDSPQDVDDAMKLGYNWIEGPFELIDRIGAGKLASLLEADGRMVPDFLRKAGNDQFYKVEKDQLVVRHHDGSYHPIALPQGAVRFSMLRRTLSPAFENDSASVFHIDGGARLVEFHSKANALDEYSVAALHHAVGDPGAGIIIHNDAQHFSSGVNLNRFLSMIDAADWEGIDAFLLDFQKAAHALQMLDKPVAGAPTGLALGGGMEVLLHCHTLAVHMNCVMGLVEPLVGLIPGGGGVKETYRRALMSNGKTQDSAAAARQAFDQIFDGVTGTSPLLSARLNYVRLGSDASGAGQDTVVANRDRLVAAALASMKGRTGAAPAERAPVRFAPHSTIDAIIGDRKAKHGDRFSAHDEVVARALLSVFCDEDTQCPVDDWMLFDRERKAFLTLARTSSTRERIAHMLANGSALRN